MDKQLKIDELAKNSSLCLDDVLFLIDHKVIRSESDIDDLSLNHDALEKIHITEQLLKTGYTLDQVVRIFKQVGRPNAQHKNSFRARRRKQNLYTPGQLAKHFDVSPRAIKYWEEKKLIRPITRSKTGIRFYHKKTLLEIMLLKGFQDLGFSLDEIKIFLDLYHFILYPKKGEKQRIEIFFSKLDELDKKLADFQISVTNLTKLSSKGRERLNKILKQQSK